MATTDANGALVGAFQYDPFGNQVGTTNPTNTATGSTFGWVGQHEKTTETNLTLQPTQMGARVYLPTTGRFLQVDPIEGGVQNNYVYPPDPVNDFDLTGQLSFDDLAKWSNRVVCYGTPTCLIAASGVGLLSSNSGSSFWSGFDTGKLWHDITGSVATLGVGGAGVIQGASGIVKAAASGQKNLGTAGRLTSAMAGLMWTKTLLANTSKNGLTRYRGPAIKRAGDLVSNFERFIKAPSSKKSFQFPNRYINGHLNIKGWW